MISDQELIAQIIQGSDQAFEVLFERYESDLRRYLLAILPDETSAQDLVQEVFLRVWRYAGQWNGQGPVKAWLYRIAVNQAFNAIRSRRRRPEQPLDTPDDWDDSEEGFSFPRWLVDNSSLGPDMALEREEQSDLLQQLIASLPGEKRDAFRLVHLMEMSIKDTADELGIPEGTVKSRLHYAKTWLSQEWRKLESE